MGLFSSIGKAFKGVGKALGGSAGVLGSLTGGVTSLFSDSPGDSFADIIDPGNIFHQGAAQREASAQWQLEYDLNKDNYFEQKRVNDANIKAQQDAFDYQKMLNETQMQREDTAVQRRVADLKAAGLSPTLAAGSPATSTPVHAGTAPQGVAPQMQSPSAIKAQAAMFKEQMEKERMQLVMSMLGNWANISKTKAETEFIKSQKGYQDVVTAHAEEVMQQRIEAQRLDNIAKNMANNFNQLANPARLQEMQTHISTMKKQLKILDFDEKIKTNESLRQIYYNTKAKFDAALAGYNVDLSKARKEQIDADTAIKAYSLTYAVERGIPISGLNQWQVLYDIVHELREMSRGDKAGLDKYKKGFDFEEYLNDGLSGMVPPF